MALEEGISQYFAELKRFELLTKEEEKELAKRIAKGDQEAKEKLIKGNLRLVVSIATKYTCRGLSFLDLIEEGNLGLLKAVPLFRLEEGCKFSTYASWWIHQSIKRALTDTSKQIRIPAYMVNHVAEAKRGLDKLKKTKGYLPDLETALLELGYSIDRIPILVQALKIDKAMLQMSQIGEDNSTLEIKDKKTKPPYSDIEEKVDKDYLERLLGEISKREADILKMRYGFDNRKPMSLKEIGDKINLSRERVRQIEAEGLRKLNYHITKGKYAQAQ